MKNEESRLIKSVELMQNGNICYSGGALNSYDKMAEVAIKSLGCAEGPCFIVCAVDRSLVPSCILFRPPSINGWPYLLSLLHSCFLGMSG